MGKAKNLNRSSTKVASRRKRRLSSLLMLFVLGAVTLLIGLRVFRAAGLDHSHKANVEAVPRSTYGFEPTAVNKSEAPQPVPDGMAWIPGGEFSRGANDPPDLDDIGMRATQDARPVHRVYVDGFFMDTTDVTNAQFAKFVKATGYVPVAERTPRYKVNTVNPEPHITKRRVLGVCFTPGPLTSTTLPLTQNSVVLDDRRLKDSSNG